MDFQDRLKSIKKRIEGNMPPAHLDIMHKATHDLEKSGTQEKVLKVGQKAPAFEVPN